MLSKDRTEENLGCLMSHWFFSLPQIFTDVLYLIVPHELEIDKEVPRDPVTETERDQQAKEGSKGTY